MLVLFYLSLLFFGVINTINLRDNFNYLILVNKKHKLPDNYESIVNLIEAKNSFGNRTFEVEAKAYENFDLLRTELLNNNKIQIELDSVYRSVAEQQRVWDEFMEKYGEEYTKKYVAVPGYSEHHTGLAIDVCLVVNGTIIDDNDEMIAQKEIFDVIHSKLADHGFILRYLKGKESITGYSYEPWHFRYVGEKDAKEIKKKGITLEEYLGMGNIIFNFKLLIVMFFLLL